MELTQQVQGKWTVLSLVGAINAPAAPALETALGPLAGGERGIILDFTRVNYLSSLGARVIIAASRKHRPVRGPIVICGLSPSLVTFMEISGLDEMLVVVPTLKDALALKPGK